MGGPARYRRFQAPTTLTLPFAFDIETYSNSTTLMPSELKEQDIVVTLHYKDTQLSSYNKVFPPRDAIPFPDNYHQPLVIVKYFWQLKQFDAELDPSLQVETAYTKSYEPPPKIGLPYSIIDLLTYPKITITVPLPLYNEVLSLPQGLPLMLPPSLPQGPPLMLPLLFLNN